MQISPRHPFRHIQKSLLLGLCLLSLAPQAANAQRPPAGVIVAPVALRSVSDEYEVPATVLAKEAVAIASPVDDQIETIHFESGQTVTRGQLLVTLKQQQEQAALAAARAALREKTSALDRVLELQAQNLASAAELELAQAALQAAEASVQAREAELADRTIRAPFSGTLGIREHSPGAYVRKGDVLTQLSDDSQLRLEFWLPSNWAQKLNSDIQLTARLPESQDRYPVRLQSRALSLDEASRSLRVRAWLDSAAPQRLPGSLMLLQLRGSIRQALEVPEAAIIPGKIEQTAYVVADGKAMQRSLSLGRRQQGWVEVSQGLQANDQVIIHGAEKLRPGAEVKIIGIYDGSVPLAELLRKAEK